MPSQIVELIPDRSLLYPDFQGFKLSLETPPVIKQELTSKPCLVYPNADQYSLLHATLFGLHNHLYPDQWDPNTCYFIDESWNVFKITYNVDTGRMNPLVVVWKIPDSKKVLGCYNATLKIISNNFAIITDGNGNIHLVETGDRLINSKWKIMYSNSVNDTPCILKDARLELSENKVKVHCLLLRIEKGEKHFENILNWITFNENDEKMWVMSQIRQLQGYGALYYCFLEPGCQALVIASDHRFKFTADSENPLKVKETSVKSEDITDIEEADAEVASKSSTVEEEIQAVKWSQVDDEIFFILNSKTELSKSNIKVTSSVSHLKIEHNNEILFDEALFDKIDSSLTTWILEGNSMNITIFKNSAESWNRLTKDVNERYLEVVNPAVMAEIRGTLDQICLGQGQQMGDTSRIQDELDDCDYDTDYDTKETALERLSIKDHNSSHYVNMGTTGPLFSAPNLTNPEAMPIIVIRHDVDGIVWQIPSCESNWPPLHLNTLPAFAYVQASKQQRKFSSCAPDFSYFVICDSTKHIFFYWPSSGVNLFNRTERKFVNHGVQKVVGLEGLGEVVGLHAQNETLLLLTKDKIVSFQLKTSEF